jgi:hypothetical protein
VIFVTAARSGLAFSLLLLRYVLYYYGYHHDSMMKWEIKARIVSKCHG